MKIILLRHGLAATVEQSGVTFDAERPLTEEGRRHAQKVAEFLQKNSFVPSEIVCSPFVRSQQTAEIISRCLGEIPVQTTTAIIPGSGVDDLLGVVSENCAHDNNYTLVCGHEPDNSYFLAKVLLKAEEFPLKIMPGDVYVLNITFKDCVAAGKIVAFYSPFNTEKSEAH